MLCVQRCTSCWASPGRCARTEGRALSFLSPIESTHQPTAGAGGGRERGREGREGRKEGREGGRRGGWRGGRGEGGDGRKEGREGRTVSLLTFREPLPNKTQQQTQKKAQQTTYTYMLEKYIKSNFHPD